MPLVLVCLLAAAVNPAPQSYLERFLAAWNAVERDSLEEALILYEDCLMLAPESPILALHLACTHAKLGRFDEATVWLDRAIASGFADRDYLEWEPDLAVLRASIEMESRLGATSAVPAGRAEGSRILWNVGRDRAVCSPDGLRAVSDGYLWDLATGDLIAEIDGANRWSNDVLFHPAGYELVTLSGGRIAIWDAVTGAHLTDLEPRLEPGARHLELSADGRLLLCHGRYTRGLWDLTTREFLPLRKIYPSDHVRIDPTGERLVFIDRGYAVLLDIATGEELLRLKRIGEPEYACFFRADGARLALHDANGNAWLVDPRARRLLRRVHSRWADKIVRSAFDGNDGSWVTIRRDGRMEWWGEGADPIRIAPQGAEVELAIWERAERLDAEATKRLHGRLEGEAIGIRDSGWFRDGTRVWVEAWDGTLRVFDLASGAGGIPDWARDRNCEIHGFAPDGSWMLTREGPTWQVRASLDGEELWSFRSRVVEADPSGERLLVQKSGYPVVVSARTGEVLVTLLGSADPPFEWSPDGLRIAGVVNGNDVVLWDTATGARLPGVLSHEGPVSCLDFDSTGERLAVATGNARTEVWDLASAAILGDFYADDLFDYLEGGSTRFTTDDRFLLATVSGESALELFDAKTFERRWFVSESWPGAITPSGHLYTGDKILALESGATVHDLGSKGLYGPKPSRDERWILARRDDATVVMRGADMRELYTRVEQEGGGSLVFTPALVHAGTAGAIRGAYLRHERGVLPLGGYASVLCDPRRIRAAAAGVQLAAPILPEPPLITSRDPNARQVEVFGDEATLAAAAEDPRGILGFELEIDGRVVAMEDARPAWTLAEQDRMAELRWRLPRAALNERTQVRVRAIGRSGVLGAPWHVTLLWH